MMVDVPGAAPAAPATKKARGASKQAPDHGKTDDHPKPGGNGKDKEKKGGDKGSEVPAALGLGWRMEQLYRGVVKEPEREHGPADRLGDWAEGDILVAALRAPVGPGRVSVGPGAG